MHYIGAIINHCNIISNECSITSNSNGVISSHKTSQSSLPCEVIIHDSIISNNIRYYLFYAEPSCSIKVSSCFIPTNTYTEIKNSNSISIESSVDSLNIKNEHFVTGRCYGSIPLNNTQYIPDNFVYLSRKYYRR